MKLLSWNIQHGGGKRTPAIVSAIRDHDPDVIVLSEFRTKPGMKLREGLNVLGWCHCESTEPPGSENGICVLSRSPLRRLTTAPIEHSVRWLDLELPEFGFAFGALHIVTATPGPGARPGEAKARFWDDVLRAAEHRINKPFMFVGDLNTGLHQVDETGSTFYCSEHFARLSTLGWIDAWRHFHADRREYSWYSRRNGGTSKGFRVDHAFVTPSLLPRFRACRYSHQEREAGISDHSVLIVEVD